MFAVLVFLLFIGKSYQEGPQILEKSKDGAIAVKEGATLTLVCQGDQVLDWRFPQRHLACYEAIKVVAISNRVKKFNKQKGKTRYTSKMILNDVSFLDVGPIECFYAEAPSISDRLYLFVDSEKNLVMPCTLPDAKSCKMPSKSTSRSIPTPLGNEKDFAPCRPTSPSVELQVDLRSKYSHVDSVTAKFDPYLGFQLVDITGHNISEYLVACGPKNQPDANFCYMKLQYRDIYHGCQVELTETHTQNIDESPHIFANFDVNLVCKADCLAYPTGFQLNLVKFPVEDPHSTRVLEKNNKTVERLGLYSYRVSSSVLLEKVSSQRDNGVYSCQLTLPSQSIAHNWTLSVKTPRTPSFLNPDALLVFDVTSDVDNLTTTVDFDCWADGEPLPRYSWFHSSLENKLVGEKEKSGELVRQMPEGVYICQVNNSVGSVLTRNFYVRSPNSTVVVMPSTAEPPSMAKWIIALVAAVCLGMVLAVALLALFIVVKLRRKNRRAVLRELWKKYFAEAADGFAPLDPSTTSILLATPRSISMAALNFSGRSSTVSNSAVEQVISQSSNLETGEQPTMVDVLEQLPYNNNVWEIDQKQLKFKEVLGRGSFGVVYKADLVISDTFIVPVAVKCMKDSYDTSQYKALISEIKLLASLGKHVNIVNLIGATSKLLEEGILYMVLEFCEGGSLRRFLNIHRDRFFQTEEFDYFSLKKLNADLAPEEDDYLKPASSVAPQSPVSPAGNLYARTPTTNAAYYRNNNTGGDTSSVPLLDRSTSSNQRTSGTVVLTGLNDVTRERLSVRDLTTFAYQIANGMEFLHDSHCLHRDLAARNVLVCSENIVKITDFGLAKDVLEPYGEYRPKASTKVPYKWLPPEALQRQIYNKYTDIWAYGVLLWEIFTLGKVPYADVQRFDEAFVQNLLNDYRLPKPDYADDVMWNIILACWHSKPNYRPNFKLLKEEIGKKLPIETIGYYENKNSGRPVTILPGISEESNNFPTKLPHLNPPPPPPPRKVEEKV